MKKLIILSLTLAFITVNCTKNKAEPVTKEDTEIPCDGVTVSYKDVVESQIINLSCNVSGCHDANAAGGYSFTTYSLVADNADIISAVINHESGVAAMPFGSNKLADSLLTKFDCWIDQGKLNN